MLKKRLQIGIVGCGEISRTKHLPIWSRVPEVEVVAVCDVNEELARNVANKFGVRHHFKKLDEMLGNTGIDVVDICVPPSITSHALWRL